MLGNSILSAADPPPIRCDSTCGYGPWCSTWRQASLSQAIRTLRDMARAKMVVTTYRCWAKLRSGKRCQTFVSSYGKRCDEHKYNW